MAWEWRRRRSPNPRHTYMHAHTHTRPRPRLRSRAHARSSPNLSAPPSPPLRQTVVVTRYCDKAPAIPAPSLYYAFAKPASLRQHLRGCPAGRLAPGHGATAMKPLTHPTAGTAGRGSSDRGGDGGGCGSGGKGGGGGGSDDGSSSRGDGGRFASTKWGNRAAFICASEPLTTEVANWHLIPDNSMLCYEAGTGLRGGSGTVSASSSTAWLPSRPPLVATAPIDPQRVSARSHRSVSPGGPLMTPVPPMPSRDLAAGIRSSATFGSRRAGSDTGWESNGPSSDATGRQGGENGDMSDGGGDDEEEGWMAALHALPLASPLCKHAVARALTKLKGAAGHVPAALGAVNGGAVNDGDNSTGRADNFVNRLGVGVNSWLAESGAALPRLEAGAREAGCSGARAEAAGAQAAAAAAADALGDALAVVVRAEAAAKADSAMAGAAAEGTSDNGVGAAAGGAPDKNIGAAAGGKPDKGIEAAALALLDTCIGADVSPSTGVEPSGSSPFGAAAKAAGLESKHMGPNGTGPVARVEASHAAQPPPPPHRSTSAPPPTPTVLPTSSSDLAFFDLEAPPQDNTAGTAAHHEETAPGAQHGALADDSQRKAGGAPYTERSCAPPHRASGIDGAAEASNGSTLPSENGASDYRGVVAADGLPQPPDAARGMSAAGAAVEHGAAAIQPLAGAHGHLLNGHHPQPESETRVPQEPPCFGAGESGAGREERHVRRTPRGDDERVSVLSLHESRLDSFLAAAAGAPPPPWRQGSLLKLWGGEGPAGGQCSPRGVAAAARHRSTAEEAPGGEPTPEERLNQMSVNSELMREVDGS
jgi:hypothetical protein